MQCKKRKATIILIITVEKNEKRGVERRRRVRKKRLEFFPHHPMCTGKIKEIRRSSVGSKCA